MELSTKIRQARTLLKLTAREAADAWGVNPRTLEDYEQGRRKPRGFAQKALNELLDRILSADKPALASSEPPASPDDPAIMRKRGRPPKSKPTTPPSASVD